MKITVPRIWIVSRPPNDCFPNEKSGQALARNDSRGGTQRTVRLNRAGLPSAEDKTSKSRYSPRKLHQTGPPPPAGILRNVSLVALGDVLQPGHTIRRHLQAKVAGCGPVLATVDQVSPFFALPFNRNG